MKSKFSHLDEQIRDLIIANPSFHDSYTKLSKILLNTEDSSDENPDVNALKVYIVRNKKRILDLHEGILNACELTDVPLTSAKNIWIKTKPTDTIPGVSAFVVNPDFVPNEIVKISDLRADLIKDLQAFIPKFPKLKRVEDKNSYLLVLDPADIHIGKLCSSFETGEDYNNQIAVKRALEGVDGILQKVSSFAIDKILFIGGNDILHVDNPKRMTTSGTPQDTDGMWYDNFLIAKQLYIDILLKLVAVADVHFTFNPSNHDYTNGFFLADVIKTYFKDCKNITFDCSIAHRKGFKYYNNLIGTTHGDGAKLADLPLLMAQEFSQEWANTKHRYVYTHHVHHKTAKDFIGITVESLRSPSGTDSWHHRNGYLSIKAIEGFLHCKHNGQIARITNIF
jgi:hypothetical protein